MAAFEVNFELSVQYTSRYFEDKYSDIEERKICFTHAILRATKGEEVETEIVPTIEVECADCAAEERKKYSG